MFASIEFEDDDDDESSTKDDCHISMIYDNSVYLGSEQATRYAAINERKIEHIVSIGCEPIINLNDQINMHIAHDYFQVEDTGEKSNVDYFFAEVLPQIHLIIEDCVSKNVAVLIHCQAGISRSATAVITWLIEKRGKTYVRAYDFVKKRRSIIQPNNGFAMRMREMYGCNRYKCNNVC